MSTLPSATYLLAAFTTIAGDARGQVAQRATGFDGRPRALVADRSALERPNEAPVPSDDGPIVRMWDRVYRGHDDRQLPASQSPSVALGGAHDPATPFCKKDDFAVLAQHGEPVPTGGFLSPIAFMNPTNLSGSTGVAFFSHVDGAASNQGIFVADELGLRAIALGCGGGGGSGNPGLGCGDPTPLGGTFSGMFNGTIFAPASNVVGDVLFVADVDGGSAPRGLFLYRASTQAIVKVAAVGDALPDGGTIGFIGPGSINASGDVAFLAAGSTIGDTRILRWTNGSLASVAKAGDLAPGGGTYANVAGESLGFADGSSIPTGPVPDINDAGQIAFRGILPGGTTRGIVLATGAVHQWLVKAGDPAPGGGAYLDFQAASLNNVGQIAFFADFKPTPTTFSSGWFVRGPTSSRRVIAFFDPVAGGQCWSMAYSRNPMNTIDDAGNVVLWVTVQLPGGALREHVLLARGNGLLECGAEEGTPTPLGGAFGPMDAWPSIGANRRATVNSSTPGVAGVFSAHLTFR